MGQYGHTRVDPSAKGAYFRKISSDWSQANMGIVGEGRLPEVKLDASRYYLETVGITALAALAQPGVSWASKDFWRTGPLDRPSVYMGGHGAAELDAGLTWDRVYDGLKRPTYTDRPGSDEGQATSRFSRTPNGWIDGEGNQVANLGDAAFEARLSPNFAFRVFWRTINGADNVWQNPSVGSAANIYLAPKEAFRMAIRVTGTGVLELKIESLSRPASLTVPMREFGFGPGLHQSFKRVNSIDIKSNEGRVVPPTQSTATGGLWNAVSILQADNSLRPLMGPGSELVMGGDTAPRYDSIFNIGDQNQAGGERIDITPA